MAINVQLYKHSVRVVMTGRFDFLVHRNFKDAYMPLLGNAAFHEIEIEMSKVDYIDSSALGMLALLNDRAKAANQTVALHNPSSAVQQLLEIANFDKIFSIRHAASFSAESKRVSGARPWAGLPEAGN